tara:strand:- start:630 stop:1070 length:441 start_codon:yes stop_codon:yes gene_type:complete
MTSEKDIWFSINYSNVIDYDVYGILVIDKDNYYKYEKEIQQGIDSFNSELDWDDMWDILDAYERLEAGEKLYLYRPENYVIGYVWFKEDLLYNAFMHSSRKKGISKRFFSRAIIMNSYETTKLFVKDWNVKAIRFWKKIGFIENGN